MNFVCLIIIFVYLTFIVSFLVARVAAFLCARKASGRFLTACSPLIAEHSRAGRRDSLDICWVNRDGGRGDAGAEGVE
jgi:hypothetical protein